MVLEESKIKTIHTTLQGWLGAKEGVLFTEFHKSVSKVTNVAKGIPSAHALFSECNQAIGMEPPKVFLWKNSMLHHCIWHFHALLEVAHKQPMRCRELVTVDSDLVGIIYDAKEGTSGMVVGKKDACVSTVFCLEWPPEVQALICLEKNPNGPITNSDLEMARDFFSAGP